MYQLNQVHCGGALGGGVVLYESAIIPFFAPPCPVTAQPQLIVISHLGTKNEAVAPGSGAFVGGREDNGPTASQIVSDLCIHSKYVPDKL